MTNAQLKADIVAYSKTIGIDKIGFAAADPFKTLKQRLERQQELGYQSGFEESDIEKRTEPELLLSGATTIISIAIAYPSRMKDSPRSKKGERRGLFCRASWGIDYHHLLREKLSLLDAYIKSKVPEARTSSMVDTGELSDRAVAERAGIGFSGKNTMTITEEFGSWVYLGEMITDLNLEPDEPVEEGCGDCNICVDACPTGALIEGGQLNANKCIAFLTQTKGFLPDEYRTKLGNRLYGCDTCQLVCPKNKGKDFHHHPELEPDPEMVKPKLIPLLTMSNREFKTQFGQAAGSWRGKKPIQRNAILALAHYKDETAIDTLVEVMEKDPRPVIRGTSAWALGKIGGEKAFNALTKEQLRENDKDVADEIAKGLSMLKNKT
ncbi:tRNA epoxyqueuosine(34) reductase QueG [Alkalihalobacillus hwajinpoensis]|uniref:tRNA epoxyqueuosine(34) reductase QueG n=1 Tax=Guptibacillus hwajinpoensis TaxID=208199 RepID=UPI0018835C5F|nr:tRNA epoxyqueuosine(34) reductase QueG [Pseudalkalibacillus hwajinpoensis]MBF0706949.1 tRNA epoxyqueuosine(34) reductase QueG [Pseudalkalibacillus hwajinpoensis]